jgi:hypothetical protein
MMHHVMSSHAMQCNTMQCDCFVWYGMCCCVLFVLLSMILNVCKYIWIDELLMFLCCNPG